MEGLTIYREGRTYNGYTIFAPLAGDRSMGGETVVYLIDMHGKPLHKWKVDYKPGQYGILLPDGTLLYGGATHCRVERDGRILHEDNRWGGILQEINWRGEVIWSYRNDFMHHDYDRMPNGNNLVMVFEPLPEGHPLYQMWADAFLEVTPKGKVVWEWHCSDQMNPDEYKIDHESLRMIGRPQAGPRPGPSSGPQRTQSGPSREWTHGNSVDYLPKGNSFNGRESILTSFRHISTVMIIDKKTKEITWSWGRGEIMLQHDATLLENGNILIFDNGVPQRGSKVVEVNPKTNTIEWEYKAKGFFSGFISGAQRLPNGNTLICEGATGRIFEVTPEKEIVWEYRNPYGEMLRGLRAVFRAYRYGSEDIKWPESLPPP